ncbi:coiled-coil domain-containing protein 13 isoform X2 [Tenebrio molitor]
MRRENESLQQQLSRKDSEIQQCQIKSEELTARIADYESCCKSEYTSASQLANSKIVELSKKLREKNSEIQVYKSKYSKLENTVLELKKQSENVQEIDKEDNCVTDRSDEVKKLQEKLTSITNKWIEEKNINLQLKNDLKKANKWLQQETGEKFETLLTLSNTNTSWRGRAQIICDLQQKNLELKEKLKAYQENNNKVSTYVEPNQAKYDKKIEELNTENAELQNNYLDLKRKFNAVKARCKVLETEYGVLKAKLSNSSDIHETDQQTITKITSQLSYFNELKNEDLKQKDQTIKNLQQENESLKVELVKEKYLSENKSKELLEKNDDIQLLNKRIRSSRPPSSYVHRHENTDTKTISRLEVERLKLLELTEIQNARLQDERNAHSKTQNFLRMEKQKCAKLEANFARLQLEQTSSRSGYSTSRGNTPKQIEYDIKDKLELAEENVKALTTRLEIETFERKHDLQEFTKILKNYE